MGLSRQVRVVAGRKVTATVVVQESNWRLVEVGSRGWIPAGGCWLMNSFRSRCLRELRERAEGRSLFIRQIVLKHLVWAKHYAKHWGAWG